ncbi:hypothetical protein [Erwinia psidii]|uniref:Uncharacterized protein n=1 Tax=Erwinia psidii TaxID=69224 RepID=A0A3N6RZZ1_9GAMM|nr:hypothetical protein [Erwinia psidii]MCX8958202.1 hypothetical protein [Erwinia psidii]MCX8963119.1 hypothetical protein [Erwinia psidii]MCX8966939.1 hypothetical protein [Erwinia psidii]RQM38067.1 hypothetical protein EB241_12390 [Erwinia psidii]
MRDLTSQEVHAVSGAGALADLVSTIGAAIGSIVDQGTALGGLDTDAETAGKTLGSGIGSLLEMDFVSAINNIGSGVIGIVSFGISAISQLRAKKAS